MTEFIRAILIWVFLWALPVLGLTSLVYFLSTLPARRREKARLFLDLLHTGLEEGRSLEHTVTSLARTRDRTLGVRFYLVAAYLEEGESLFRALQKVPAFLPPGVTGVLAAGAQSGKLMEAMQAARRSIAHPISRTTHAIHYAFVLVLTVLPFCALFLPWWSIKIFPVMMEILRSMEVTLHPLTLFAAAYSRWLAVIYAVLMLAVGGIFIAYLCGPGLCRPDPGLFRRLADRFHYALPWWRKRLLRDFSLQLALLLEAGLPESVAVETAGRGTPSYRFQGFCDQVRAKLAAGVALPAALGELEQTQLTWRFQSAAGSGRRFVDALRHWHEALEAEAARSEDVAAHLLSSGMVVFNGVMVGLMVSAVFVALSSMVNEAALW